MYVHTYKKKYIVSLQNGYLFDMWYMIDQTYMILFLV